MIRRVKEESLSGDVEDRAAAAAAAKKQELTEVKQALFSFCCSSPVVFVFCLFTDLLNVP